MSILFHLTSRTSAFWVLSLDEGRTLPLYGSSSTSATLVSDAGGVLPVPHVLGIVGFVPKHVVAGAPIRSRHYVLAPERETVLSGQNPY
jgi:hypothetical protein